MDELTAHAALSLALRISPSVLAVGASRADVTWTMRCGERHRFDERVRGRVMTID